MIPRRRQRHASEPKLFRIEEERVTRLIARTSMDEKSLQTLLERHLKKFLGVLWLATEYSTGKLHGGRIDTLGIDARATPVIIEYKRRRSVNLINQGLFYLDWLLDHRAEFQLLVEDRMGIRTPARIDWTAPRLICVAQGFNRYDLPAARQFKGRIELVRYQWFGKELLMLERVDAVR